MNRIADTPWVVVGLGNPGPKYADTPHNIGWLVVDELAARAGRAFGAAKRTKAATCHVRIAGEPALLVKPLDFMNNSGGPTKAVMTYYKCGLDRLVVVHDEIDLDPHVLRLKLGGGDNGHNGLRSLRASLGSGDFLRVRVGVGRGPGRQDPADYLLKPYPAVLRKELPLTVDRAADAVEALLADGLAKAQNQFNG
jgi:PTH1 family peptidyl-tRNA hydrolase